MDMSVKAGGHATNVQQPKRASGVHRSNASELDAWLEKAEAMGELKRITAEVSPDLETAHITYLVGLEKVRRCSSRTSRVIQAIRPCTT